ncbi:uncharacterized protein LOC110021963 [Phalaenopsis equestris]|uniref:uncharacterized protein LOC110021963 n=1 Tax=Phalaenopsis equestris TaxID=78828 RepID=UPI0009E28B00|nr:uncharacterized protein LOC110021963 [Phalaenopsis equestris]
MGQTLCVLRDKAQGKLQVRRICDKVFDQFADTNLLSLDKLHVATLMVYNSVNKQLLSPHKEPPSLETVRAKVESIRSEYKGLDKAQFYGLIMEWIHRDLRVVLANRVVLSLLAAPLMAIKTKSAAMKVRRIRNIAEKVPTPLIISAYSVALVLLQDSRVK